MIEIAIELPGPRAPVPSLGLRQLV